MCDVVKNHKKLQHAVQQIRTRFEFFTHRRCLIKKPQSTKKNPRNHQKSTEN